MAEKVQQKWVDKILKFARCQHGSKDILDLMNDGILDNPSKTDGMIIMLTYSSIQLSTVNSWSIMDQQPAPYVMAYK